MRVKSSLVAAVLALSMAGAAQAVEMVWFEAAPANALSTVSTQGAPGVRTKLNCLGSVGVRCEWDITVRLLTGSDPTAGWSADLLRNDADLTIKTQNYGPAYPNTQPPQVNQGNFLINDWSAFSTAPPGPGANVILATFRLSKNKTLPLPLPNPYLVSAGIGAGEWAGADYSEVQFADNPIITGDNQGANVPVIEIRNIPEPATLGLLAFGALTLIRRKVR